MSLCVIHTGGTIGMGRTATGFAPQTGVVEAELARLQTAGVIGTDVRLRVAEPLIDSANATLADWNWIMDQIAEAAVDCTGVIVTHGTDTLAFTAAALGFGLQGLNIPVVLTGSMLPLTEVGSDGPRNLAEAFAAVETLGPGIWVQFAGAQLHGLRVRKSHSSAFDAFKDTATDVAPLRVAPTLRVQPYEPSFAVLVVAVAPGMATDLVTLAAERADGIVLRCYGSGTVPESAVLRAALCRARDRGVPVLAVSQCAEGGISLGTYAAGAMLAETGAIDGRDMTVEAAYTKLLHALSATRDPDDRRQLLQTRLGGEWSE
ncbi:asparaginase [Tritonibacter horizontis]|uniref:L-asparaginase 1 n=1 Tax=Tritonibacter horizontis TaxID=1768241 RepID=A0A132BVP2_9RHOB|nr:asparaginase [Tritonibacter horizontis]KUP91897.1 L-asparaginase 1 [Tritonibacter horizontis]